MKLEFGNIVETYKQQENLRRISMLAEQNNNFRLLLKGLSGSSPAIIAGTVLQLSGKSHFFILHDKEEAAYFYNDLLNILPEKNILIFPSSYRRSIQYGQTDDGQLILRTHALNQLNQFDGGLLAVVTYPEAILEKVPSKDDMMKNTLTLNKGELISIDFIKEILETYHFEQVDFIYEPGQYAIRGSIVDVFSFSAEYPFRIDFFGDEVDSIRAFEAESQLSTEKLDTISIVPDVQRFNTNNTYVPVTKLIGNGSIFWSNDFQDIISQMDDLSKIIEGDHKEKQNLYSGNELKSELVLQSTIEFGNRSMFEEAVEFNFNTRPQPLFRKNFMVLGENLRNFHDEGYSTIILSENEKQIDRITDIFRDTNPDIRFDYSLQVFHGGYIDDDIKTCLFTDHQIFDRYHKYRLHKYYSGKASISLNELRDLKPGDYIVHSDHGIGRFGGLEKINMNGRSQETIRLVYRDNDVLYVNIHSLHRISKYKGKDDKEPRINKLGSGAWQKLKENTKKKVKDIAKDLIALYALRRSKEGFGFSADTYLQEELEASFIYEDTPDQVTTTKAVKSDMESKVPMDRLICGDVGFGKTEVAIRAAFKAVTDSKQVAVLVPTTILALQHYSTFRDRLKEFPCKVEYVSRLRSPSQQKKILQELSTGQVDILIGTHRLLGKDIKFKDLGLLIIDEEQKFGVAAKEKLRSLRANVDTLTMTATPIPRTLQFSMMGSRDLSVINTPPPNRHPIVTELHTFDERIIQEGINFEVSRGGQVFFIHNRVQNLQDIEKLIKKLCPDVKIAAGHGQMDGTKLEQTMIDFINGDYDVLVATTIIESGLDIPNANTIFINNAHNFGLSDLHQLRGRVGRSNKRAFCYLMAPPLSTLTPEARRRLRAIEELSDLGSGFNIALQDLDIRGAGNLLGAEQSGFIADIGFETYNNILNEAIHELKENEFRQSFSEENMEKTPSTFKVREFVTDCVIETDLEVNIPDDYISNVTERIKVYREIDLLKNQDMMEALKINLTDRFGNIPGPLKSLFKVVEIRWLAEKLGFEKIILKNDQLTAHFISNQNSDYYKSDTFARILRHIQQVKGYRIREWKDKLTLSTSAVKNIDEMHDLFQKLNKVNGELSN